jgi:hypothetical protein
MSSKVSSAERTREALPQASYLKRPRITQLCRERRPRRLRFEEADRGQGDAGNLLPLGER